MQDISDIQLNLETENVYNGAWATSIVFGEKYSINSLDLIDALAKLGIPSRPFFYPLSSQPAYRDYTNNSDKKNPVSYNVFKRGITMASHYNLTNSQIEYICSCIKKII